MASKAAAGGRAGVPGATDALLTLCAGVSFGALLVVVWSLIDIDAVSAAALAGLAAGAALVVAGTGAIEVAARQRGSVPSEAGNAARLFAVVAFMLALPAILVQLVDTGRAQASSFAPHACPEDDVPAAAFRDLRGHVHESAISCAAWWGLGSGLDAHHFAPEAPVTGRQLDVVLARVFALTDESGDRPTSGVAAGAAVSRARLAAALSDLHEVLFAESDEPVVLDAFRDDEGHPLEQQINRAAALSIVVGSEDRLFAPGTATTRAQAMSAVLRLVDGAVARGSVTTPSSWRSP